MVDDEQIREVMKNIAGEIVISGNPGKTLKKWRKFFKVTQAKLAKKLEMSPSVICDYESNRRKSPGINIIKRIIKAMIDLDLEQNGTKLDSLRRIMQKNLPAGTILDIREFEKPVKASSICKALNARIFTSKNLINQPIYGYTIIDSVKAITDLSSEQLIEVFGKTPERCLIFTNAQTGKSTMIAIKTAQALGKLFKPSLVILQSSKKADPLAIKLAQNERIILASSNIKNVSKITESLLKTR